MSRLPLVAGQPLAQVRNQMTRSRQSFPVPTGDAVLASSSSLAATATASATPHTMGAWTEVVAATATESFGLLVVLAASVGANGVDSSCLLDIGIGPAASEVVVVPHLEVGYGEGFGGAGRRWRVPLLVPAGSRIAIRAQGAVVSQPVSVSITPLARISGSRPAPAVVAHGANPATSRGVVLPFTAINTKGAWAEVVAATPEAYTALMLGLGGSNDTSFQNGTGLLDIGVGASGSEVVVVPNVPVLFSTSEQVGALDLGAWSVDVPAGSRLSVRAQITTSANSLDAIVYGIR